MIRVLFAVTAVICGAAACASAQEIVVMESLKRAIEMPAHRALVSEMQGGALSDFETDGCSGGMSWSWGVVADVFPGFEAAQGARPPWEDCCVIHDRAYHAAGGALDAEASYAARLAADDALRQCVAEPAATDVTALAARYAVSEDRIRLAYELIATSMYNAVRFGGGPCTVLPWRWGFGYPGCLPGL